MFINELLNKTVKDESHAREVFEFLCHSLIALDSLIEGYENFHLIFMIKLSRYLGFGVQNINEVLGGRVTDKENETLLRALIEADYHENVVLTNIQRRNLLDLLLKFYGDHMETMGEMKSVQVLRDILI